MSAFWGKGKEKKRRKEGFRSASDSEIVLTHNPLREALSAQQSALAHKSLASSSVTAKEKEMVENGSPLTIGQSVKECSEVEALSEAGLFNLVKECKNEEELKSVYYFLLYTRAGRHILCNIEKESVAEWVELLGKGQMSVFLEAIVSSIDFLEDGQLCVGKLKAGQFKGIGECTDYTELLVKSTFMRICMNEDLMKKLACTVKGYFSFSILFDTAEKQRAAISNESLFKSGQEKIEILRKHSILTLEQIRKIGHMQLSGKINRYKEEWLRSYKEIVVLSVQYWEPSYEDLKQITRIWNDWVNIMSERLATYDKDAYNPMHYDFDKLPIELKRGFKICKGHVDRYQGHIAEMQVCYIDIMRCDEEKNSSCHQPCLRMDGYKSFVELIEEVTAEKGFKSAGEQRQHCAEKLTELFLAVTKSPEMPETLKFLHLHGKQFDGKPEIFYIKIGSYKLFRDYLQEKEAVVVTKNFASVSISLNEGKAIDAIQELLIPPAVQESKTPHKLYFSL